MTGPGGTPTAGRVASRTTHRADQLGRSGRLTAGWRSADGSGSLLAHLDRYGPMPQHGSGRRDALIEAVTHSGLTGRGGAGFPTGAKMRSVASGRGPAVVVVNGMESEPASQKDKALLARAPHLALDGAVLAARAIRARSVQVCLPQDNSWLWSIVDTALTERRQTSPDDVAIEMHALPANYVSSEETSIVHWLNGGEARPTAVPPRPFEKGVGGRPTLLDNVETLAHVALIGRFGPAWYRQSGLPDAPGTMLTTVSGAVDAPGVYEIEVGTRIGDVLATASAGPDVGTLLIGGYFGTWHDAQDVADLPLAAPALRGVGASPGAGVLVVLPPDACGLRETARVLTWLASQSAGQCGPCVFGLPAIADDFAQLASGRPAGPTLDRLERRLSAVIGRGGCRHPDGAVRLARSALASFAADLKSHVSRRTCVAARHASRAKQVLPIPRPSNMEVWR
ncbi:MAG TPA: NADH-ubiquinone oxidoreductase-F iron-sulfur binding region domain-containing protein [Streptosporangiaceae bacterium]|nr:NADH-ubiquinone oxidoreductase-F iron-sulfur binding region domain-containing protein [Streptosporangiaceae bacterium]